MGYITNQVRYAIDELKAAGYKRDEYSVTVERRRFTDRYSGRRCTEYGDAQIVVYANLKRQMDLADACKQAGLILTFWVLKGKLCYPLYEDSSTRRPAHLCLTNMDTGEQTKYQTLAELLADLPQGTELPS